MKRFFVLAGMSAVLVTRAAAQAASVDELERDLTQYKTQHDEAKSQTLTTFFTQLDAASQSGGVALDLYKKADGKLPDLAPVTHHYEYETPSEKAAREAKDALAYASVAIVVQIHCGLMRNAAAIVLQPKSQEVHDKWVAWLKTMAQVYPQLAGDRALKHVPMRDSPISKYLGFDGWGNAEPGGWSINDMPGLYKELVLQPLRNPPGPGTLDAWDTYEAMVQADDPDHDHFTNSVQPAMDFDRAADDFTIEPTIEKLTTIDALIKANQTNSHLDEWIARTRQMIAVYRAGGRTHTPLPGPTPSAASPGSTGITPGATPGTSVSGSTGITPGATPGTSISGTAGVTPGATPGTTSSGALGVTPGSTPGSPTAGGFAPTPGATPGTPSSGAAAPIPAPTPGVATSGTTAPTPTATPGTPSSGGPAPTPTATP